MMTNVDDSLPVLEVKDVRKTYGGVKALDGVSIVLKRGEILCLAGENGCGKSTLIKVISGVEQPDSGQIIVDGEVHQGMNATQAIKSGIQVIYQDFSLFPNLTVAENILLTSAVADQQRLFNKERARAKANEIIADLGLDLDIDREVESLSVADKQLTAICRALVHDARLIILDEPTTALTHTEVGRLFAIVEKLRLKGVAMIFVSHKLDEVLRISQRVSILRSGKNVMTAPASELSIRMITEHMTGRELDDSRIVSELPAETAKVLEVESLSLEGGFKDVTFSIAAGEIVGLTGLLGSGRTEIAESIFGVTPADSGRIKVDGVVRSVRGIKDAIRADIAYVPEDRLTQGLFLEKSIADNLVASSLDLHSSRAGLIDLRRVRKTIFTLFARLRIKAPDSSLPVRSLSGGNAQRVVLAKWLARKPKVLILNGPTVGVDVGSKSEILSILRAEAQNGMGVLVISDDVSELVSCCHRVLIVRGGKLVAELSGNDVEESLIREKVDA